MESEMDEMMDREYDKKLATIGDLSNKPSLLPYDEWEANRQGKITNMLAKKGYGYRPSKGKILSEKEAKKLSEKDSDKAGVGTLDDMAIDERVKDLKKQDWWDRTFKRSDEDDQLLLEDRIKSERSLKKKLATQPSPYGRADYEGSLYRPFESPLKKRIRKRREKEARTAKARSS